MGDAEPIRKAELATWLLFFFVPVLHCFGLVAGGLGAWLPAAGAAVMPWIASRLPEQDPEADSAMTLRGRVWLLCQVGLFMFTAARVRGSGGSVESLGWLVGMGLVGAGGIGLSRLLLQQRDESSWKLAVPEALLVLVAYPQLSILRQRPDLAVVHPSPERGESLWHYLPKSVGTTMQMAWHFESDRIRGNNLAGWTDRRVRLPLCTFALLMTILLCLGWSGALCWLVSSSIAILILETSEYIKGYGLNSSAEFGPQGEWHLSRPRGKGSPPMPVNLTATHGREGPHHEALRLPFGYSLMVALSWIPPLWRAIMDPRLDRLSPQPSA